MTELHVAIALSAVISLAFLGAAAYWACLAIEAFKDSEVGQAVFGFGLFLLHGAAAGSFFYILKVLLIAAKL